MPSAGTVSRCSTVAYCLKSTHTLWVVRITSWVLSACWMETEVSTEPDRSTESTWSSFLLLQLARSRATDSGQSFEVIQEGVNEGVKIRRGPLFAQPNP